MERFSITFKPIQFLLTIVAITIGALPARAADNSWTNGAANLQWDTSSTDWTSPSVWSNANFDSAIFGATGVGTVTLQAPITARGLQFSVAGYNIAGTGANILTLASGGGGSLAVGEVSVPTGSATITAVIAGSVGLTKTGSGTLVVNGVNTYAGGTTITGGTFQVGNGVSSTTPAAILGNVQIAAGATLAFNIGSGPNNTYDGVISGNGNMIKNGSALIIMNADQTFTGSTTVNNGRIEAHGNFAGNINVNLGGTFDFAPAPGQTFTYGGLITGTGGFNKLSGGRVIITQDQTFAGFTSVFGILQLGNGGTTGMMTQNIGIGSSGALAFNRSDTVTFSNTLSGVGGVNMTGPGTVIMTANNTNSGTTQIFNGTLQIGNGGTTGALNGNFVLTANLVFNRSDNITYNGIISGPASGSLNKQGAGVLTLTNASTFAGTTNVSTGTLALAGTASIASSPTIIVNAGSVFDVSGLTGGLNHNGTQFALASGQTLKGTGTLIGGISVRAGSTLRAGNATGTSTVAGSAEFLPGSTLGIALNGLGNTDADRSRLVTTGSLTFSGTAGLPFTVLVTNAGAFPGTTAASFTIADAASISSIGLDTPLTLNVGAGGAGAIINNNNIQLSVTGFVSGQQFTLARSGSNFTLAFVPAPVPEPATALGFTTLLVLGFRFRRKLCP